MEKHLELKEEYGKMEETLINTHKLEMKKQADEYEMEKAKAVKRRDEKWEREREMQ
jgi:hypothetical protein